MMPRASIFAGLIVLALAWGSRLPHVAQGSFAAHMVMHMAVVAVAAPLLAFGLARTQHTAPAVGVLSGFPMAASLLDLVVIWGWHTPLAHEFARTSQLGLVLEQSSFAAAGLLLWLTALRAGSDLTGRLAGAGALLFTSMHMTLLGVLIGLASAPICKSPSFSAPLFGLNVMQDQQVGGILMLGVGGAVYLIGGLTLVGQVLASRASGEAAQ